MITSMIGGLQMFDVPQILTNGKGGPDRTSTTMIMYLNNRLFSKNYGLSLIHISAFLCQIFQGRHRSFASFRKRLRT